MSHADKGINVNLFHEPVFNFAFTSNDLFYFYNLIKKLKRENAKIGNIKYCILEMPYYIFNWDRSRSQSAFRCMNAYTILGEYHHLDTREGCVIEQYRIFEDMFKQKKTYNASVYNARTYEVHDKISNKDYVEISHVWRMNHEDTLHENFFYFKELITLLYHINRNIKIYVVVFPQNPRFYKRHEEVIDNARDKFYEIIDSTALKDKITLLDYFKLYDGMECYFEDDCHLNTSGRNAFTKTIIQRLEEK